MEPLDTDVVNLAKAIRQQESGGNFNAIGDNGDSKGAYQFNKGNYNVWAKQYLGDENLPFTPENQNKVAYHRIKDLKNQGYNPGQIAAIWNSGQPDVNVVPEYVQNVYRNYQQVKGISTPQTVSQPIEETRQGRIEQGLPVSVNPGKAAPTKAGEFVRGLIKPVATLLARPYQVGLAIGGASPEKQTIHSKYLGDIEAPTTAKDVVKDVGRGLETVSLGIGGGGAANLAKGVTKEAITKLAVQGAKEGALAGALGSGGAAIEEGKPLGKVLGQTAIGTAAGGTIGGVLGVAAPLAARGISTATKGAGTALKATGLIKSTADDAEKAVRSVAEEYERAAGGGLPSSFRKSQKTRKGELKPWNQTVAEYGIVPQEGIDKSWDVENALTDIDAINDEFAKTKANFIKNENARFNIDEALRVADSKIDSSTPSEVARNKAKAKIREEVDAVLAKSKPEINDAGERLLTAQDIERIRDIGYSLTPFDPADSQKIGKAAGYSLAKAVNETIDKYATFPSYRSFNREWSNILNAQEALEHLKTKKVRLSKGLSGQIAMKALGPIFGYSKGGIIGAILGDLGADTAGRLLSDPQLRTMVQRSIIQKAGQKMPKEKIIGALEKEIADYVANQATLPQLPAAGQTSAPLYGTGEIKTPQSIKQEESAMKAGQEMFKRQGLLKGKGETPKTSLLDKINNTPNKQGGFIKAYEGEKDLTTKILKDLEGKTTVSKQYILDATNRGELKQVERDLIREIVSKEGDTVNVADFAKKVKAELLPLKRVSSDISYKENGVTMRTREAGAKVIPSRYESISLPSEVRGDVKNYRENIYESPIKTSAGETHFSGNSKNYFGHTRIEDMADNKTRRVIEVQSDLYQKGNLEREMPYQTGMSESVLRKLNPNSKLQPGDVVKYDEVPGKIKEYKITENKNGNIQGGLFSRNKEVSKLQQYNDPTAHFRMVREEIKKAAQDGKTKLQFPTGETAMKIEGLGESTRWRPITNRNALLKQDDLKVGMSITGDEPGVVGTGEWIITDVLGDGKFKAVPKDKIIEYQGTRYHWRNLPEKAKNLLDRASEEFDISGKVDTSNPIYKFYEKEMQKYLNKFGGKKVVDEKGVSWIEVPIKKEMANQPVEAFGKIKNSPLFIGAGAGLAGTIGAGLLKKSSDKNK